jgi:hypothetical protein
LASIRRIWQSVPFALSWDTANRRSVRLSGECARCAIASDFSTQECSRSRVWSSEIQQCGRVILVPSIYFLGGLVRHGSDDRFVAMTELLNENLVNENCRSAHGESHDTLLTSASGLLFRMVYMFSQYSQSGFRDDRQLLRFERHYLNGVSTGSAPEPTLTVGTGPCSTEKESWLVTSTLRCFLPYEEDGNKRASWGFGHF